MNLDSLLQIQANFIKELNLAAQGLDSSIPFIIHETHTTSLVKDNEAFQAIVIGGTFAVSAIVQKNKGSIKIISQKKIRLPSFNEKKDFLLFMGSVVDTSVRILALNFAYPLTPIFENGKLEGRLISGTKGQGFSGLLGEKVGETLEKYLLDIKKIRVKVTIANDTICLLLSGMTKTSWEHLGAGVVGTGMNFAFCLSQHKLVNLESANFNKFPQSDSGIVVDKESLNPGKSFYEKETAGRYLYKHFNILVKKQGFDFSPISSAEELDSIARTNEGEVGKVARNLLERSAQLVACQAAAIMEFRKTNMVFVMEGSLFWKGYKYKETVESCLKKITNYKAEFIEIENSGIIGAAFLVV